MNIINRLLRKNLSRTQIAGFIISNLAGLAIVITAMQFYQDVRSIWESEDSFIKKDYLVVNKKVTSANTLKGTASGFSEADIADLEAQPWVRKVGRFTRADYRLSGSIDQGGRSLSTYMFFESLPKEFIDVDPSAWTFRPGDKRVPIIISKDYLTLYNFGLASSAGLPQISESIMESIPMILSLSSDDGERSTAMQGRITGFSNRLNTVLVPEEFMQWSNATYGSGQQIEPSRLIIDVSSPGDVAITDYLAGHDMEPAGDKSNSTASYFLNVATGVVLAVGALITLLSFFILLLSISLLMQKNRSKLHELIMLGYDLKEVARPYINLIIWVGAASYLLALGATYLIRLTYSAPIAAIGGGTGSWWPAPLTGLLLTAAIIAFNILSVRRKVAGAFLK